MRVRRSCSRSRPGPLRALDDRRETSAPVVARADTFDPPDPLLPRAASSLRPRLEADDPPFPRSVRAADDDEPPPRRSLASFDPREPPLLPRASPDDDPRSEPPPRLDERA